MGVRAGPPSEVEKGKGKEESQQLEKRARPRSGPGVFAASRLCSSDASLRRSFLKSTNGYLTSSIRQPRCWTVRVQNSRNSCRDTDLVSRSWPRGQPQADPRTPGLRPARLGQGPSQPPLPARSSVLLWPGSAKRKTQQRCEAPRKTEIDGKNL